MRTKAAAQAKVFHHTVQDCELSLFNLHSLFSMEGIPWRLHLYSEHSYIPGRYTAPPGLTYDQKVCRNHFKCVSLQFSLQNLHISIGNFRTKLKNSSELVHFRELMSLNSLRLARIRGLCNLHVLFEFNHLL
jgi:hypothetical protein